MRLFFIFFFFFLKQSISAQLDIHSGIYFHGKGGLYGSGVSIGYEYPIGPKFSMKSQLGAKFLTADNSFLNAHLSGEVYEIHQIFSYHILQKPKYTLSVAFGLNYRDFAYKVSFAEPHGVLPIRAIYIGFRNGELAASSLEDPYDEHIENNIGYTAYLKQRFHISEKFGLFILAVVEDDYDRSQTIGGISFGLSFSLARANGFSNQ